jgi:hypothetical protein
MLGYLPKQMPALLCALGQRLSEAAGDSEVQQQEAAVLQECLQVSCRRCGNVSGYAHGAWAVSYVVEIEAHPRRLAAAGGSSTQECGQARLRCNVVKEVLQLKTATLVTSVLP